jgi:hypothetical protein
VSAASFVGVSVMTRPVGAEIERVFFPAAAK